jgi:CRP/FNR family cyclic AMP-dependent transcriptional regulator
MAAGKLSGQEKRDVLATHPLFEGLPVSVLDRLAAHARVAPFAEGARIFEKGDPGLSLMLVLEGVVKISIFSDEGKEVVLNLIREGEILGEIAILDGEKRTADAWALRGLTLLVIDRRDFMQVLASEPMLGARLLKVLSDRLRQTSQQVEEISFVDPRYRLAKSILRLAAVQGVLQHPEPRITMTQKELGQMIGLSRESTNRQLREWAETGLISLEKGGFRIRAVERLEEIASTPAPKHDAF